jgi:phosphate transport system protein
MPKSKFHKDLDKQKKEILKMGHLVRELLESSVAALKHQDEELANWVISKGEEVNKMDVKNEENLLRLIALNQPVAKDMRLIACSLKMITYMARIGRYGRDIAKVALELTDKPHIAKLVNLPQMTKMACEMIDDCLKAYETKNLEFIKDLEERDDSLDAMRYSIFRECLTYMMESPNNITRCTNYVMIARYIERCGDHACKMGEKVHYMVTGDRIEIR